jgi:AraC-like DNA-binding protein
MISINVYDDQREMKQHGSFEFPVAVYHYVMSDCVMGYINWHWHEEIQLNLVTHGAVRFFADGQQVLVKEGDGFFINSGRLHMARPEADPDSSYLCLDFHPRLMSSFSGSIFEEKYVKPYLAGDGLNHRKLSSRSSEQEAVLRQLETIDRLYRSAEFGYELKIAAQIAELWLRLISLSGEAAAPTPLRSHDTAQEIIRFLRQHYQEDLTLNDVGRAVGFSASECCRLFKRVTGDTILNYLKSYRLTRSIELLEETELPVSRIALESGFNGASYYIESFKKELRQTPLQYRREHRTVSG